MIKSDKPPFGATLILLQDWSSTSSKAILQRLDRTLDASVFFVALHPNILLGPQLMPVADIRESIHFLGEIGDAKLDDKFFSSFRRRVRRYYKIIRSRESELSRTTIDRREEEVQKGEAIRTSLQNTLNRPGSSNKYIYFAEKATWRNDERYFVSPVLQVNLHSYSDRYRLKRPLTINQHSVSLLDLAINQLLQACIIGLRSDHTDALYDFTTFARNVLTDSARAIMSVSNQINLDMFAQCDSISALPYESREGTGKIFIAKRGHKNIDPEIIFKKPIELNDHRMARKALEMAQAHLSLLCENSAVYGLGQIKGEYDLRNEDLFIVEFIKQHQWKLLHGPHEMMTVNRGKPSLTVPIISPEEFKSAFESHFGPSGNYKLMYELVEAAKKQKHGTMLLISNQAENEASRLGGQVEPFLLPVKNVRPLTAIDGAILIDPVGYCHAVGAILDGQAIDTWNPSRGARYNSAVRYLLTRRKEGQKCMAIVISEDGMVNLL